MRPTTPGLEQRQAQSISNYYTVTVVEAEVETGTFALVIATSVIVYVPLGYCPNGRKAVALCPGATVTEDARMSTVLPDPIFKIPRTTAVMELPELLV
jgi:hypothetical protein